MGGTGRYLSLTGFTSLRPCDIPLNYLCDFRVFLRARRSAALHRMIDREKAGVAAREPAEPPHRW